MERINLTCEGNRILLKSDDNVFNSIITADRRVLNGNPKTTCLVEDMVIQLKDTHSERFFKKVAERCPANLIYRALAEVKEASFMGAIKKSKGALFTYKIIQLSKTVGIDLSAKGVKNE